MEITQISANECGGFKPPKGHLDTQLYPECKGWPTDRDVVKKTVEKRKKNKNKNKSKKKKASKFNLHEYREAKKKDSDYEKSPTEHGFFEECVNKNKDKDNPEAYCASIIDKAKGTTMWRGDDN